MSWEDPQNRSDPWQRSARSVSQTCCPHLYSCSCSPLKQVTVWAVICALRFSDLLLLATQVGPWSTGTGFSLRLLIYRVHLGRFQSKIKGISLEINEIYHQHYCQCYGRLSGLIIRNKILNKQSLSWRTRQSSACPLCIRKLLYILHANVVMILKGHVVWLEPESSRSTLKLHL